MDSEDRPLEQLPEQDLITLSQLARNGDIHSRNSITLQHLDFARRMARRHERNLQEDVAQSAAEGMILASERYNPEKGSYTTYARYFANRQILLEKAAMKGVKPSHLYSIPKDNPLYPSRVLSLDDMIPHEERTLLDVTPNPYSINPEEEGIRSLDRQQLKTALQALLSPKERAVLSYRFGIASPPHTLDEVGKHFGLTRERIRQIEFRALQKLREGYERVPYLHHDIEWNRVRTDVDKLVWGLGQYRPGEFARRAGIHLITLNKTLSHLGIPSVAKPPKKLLLQLYYGDRQSQQTIATTLGVRDYDVRKWFHIDGISPKSRSEALSSPRPLFEDLRRWYNVEGLTIDQIKAKTKAGYPAVKRWFKEAGIKTKIGRPPSPFDEIHYRTRAAQDLTSKLGISPPSLRTHHFFLARQDNGKTYEGLLCWYRRRHKETYSRAVDILLQELYGINRVPTIGKAGVSENYLPPI